MKDFQSISDIEKALEQKDLERKVLREEIRYEYLSFQNGWQQGWFSHPLVQQLSKLGIKYAIQRFTK